MFRNTEYMSLEQQAIAEQFTSMVEAEYALCTSEIQCANKLAMLSLESDDVEEKISINYACLEIDSIREYWTNRLVAMMQIVEKEI
ncbi:MAG: hypothetical protein HC903_26805 [Methylacidiphilales bacterium]|nr:hypothetical protein [Candidatus Methylacidiphilales bacterium]